MRRARRRRSSESASAGPSAASSPAHAAAKARSSSAAQAAVPGSNSPRLWASFPSRARRAEAPERPAPEAGRVQVEGHELARGGDQEVPEVQVGVVDPGLEEAADDPRERGEERLARLSGRAGLVEREGQLAGPLHLARGEHAADDEAAAPLLAEDDRGRAGDPGPGHGAERRPLAARGRGPHQVRQPIDAAQEAEALHVQRAARGVHAHDAPHAVVLDHGRARERLGRAGRRARAWTGASRRGPGRRARRSPRPRARAGSLMASRHGAPRAAPFARPPALRGRAPRMASERRQQERGQRERDERPADEEPAVAGPVGDRRPRGRRSSCR
jgi:hypothetical protein